MTHFKIKIIDSELLRGKTSQKSTLTNRFRERGIPSSPSVDYREAKQRQQISVKEETKERKRGDLLQFYLLRYLTLY